jgi:hypothetical protein
MSDIKVKEQYKYHNYIFLEKYGDIIFQIDKGTNILYFHKDKILNVLERDFNLTYYEITVCISMENHRKHIFNL